MGPMRVTSEKCHAIYDAKRYMLIGTDGSWGELEIHLKGWHSTSLQHSSSIPSWDFLAFFKLLDTSAHKCSGFGGDVSY